MNPKATIAPRTTPGCRRHLSGQAELFATNTLDHSRPAKRNRTRVQLKFTSAAALPTGVRMGETNLPRWLDSFIFFTMNGELDRLHQKWLHPDGSASSL
jgi:hypothetical protein